MRGFDYGTLWVTLIKNVDGRVEKGRFRNTDAQEFSVLNTKYELCQTKLINDILMNIEFEYLGKAERRAPTSARDRN